MKKRFLAALLALAMAGALLPSTALAAENYTMDFATDASLLWVGGKNPVRQDCFGTGWSWVANDKQLTLTNFSFETTATIGLKLPPGATVVLEGNSSIITAGNGIERIGIHATGNVTVTKKAGYTGVAKLTGTGLGGSGIYIYSSDASTKNITVGDGAALEGIGHTGINVLNGGITVHVGSVMGTGTNNGVFAKSFIQVTDGTLTGTATENGTGVGVNDGNITVTKTVGYSGEVKLTGKTTVSGTGVYCIGGNITVGDGAELEGTGYTGVMAQGDSSIIVSGGSVKGTGNVDCGVQAGTLSVNGGSVMGTSTGSFGVCAVNSLSVTRGMMTGISENGRGLEWGNNIVLTGCIATASANKNGEPRVPFDENNAAAYKYVHIAPALPISITPDTAFPAGMSGGDRAVVVGHGTGLLKGEIGSLSVGGNPLTLGTDYTKADSASVDITLKESWLNSLPAGTHRLNIAVTSGVFAGQTPYINIVVIGTGGAGGDADVPKTGDGSMPLL